MAGRRGASAIRENEWRLCWSASFRLRRHGEGRFYADQTTLERIQANDQVLFTYCNAEGQVDEQSNPNGAVLNIAGITNAGKNVFGMMPHPERAADRYVANEDGKLIFESLLRYC